MRGFPERPSVSSVGARLLLLVLLALLPALGLILYVGWEDRRARTIEVHAEALRLARVLAHSYEDMIEDSRSLLLSLSRLPQVLRHEAAPCGAILSDFAKRSTPRYTGIVAAKPDGAVFCSSQPLSAALNLADRAYFRRALESRDFTVGEYVLGRMTGKPVLALAAPSLDESGVVVAVVVVGLDLAQVEHVWTTFGLPQGSSLSVVDGNGTVLARYPEPEKWLGRSVGDTRGFFGALASRQQDGSTAKERGLDGIRRLYGWVRLKGEIGSGPLYARVGIPSDVAFAQVSRTLWRSLGWLGLAVVLILAVARVAATRLIVRPVRVLADAAGRLGAGDLSVRTGLPHREGEFGQLAGAFDRMADALGEREAEVARVQEALRQSEERFRSLAETAPDAIISIGADRRVQVFNRAAERIFGYSAEEIVGQSLDRLVPPEYRDRHVAGIRRYLETGEARIIGKTVELTALRKGGEEFPVALSVSATRFGDDVVFTGIIRDITERKRGEEQFRQSEKLAALGELLAGVAHELNNPLSVVLGQALLLQQSPAAGPAGERAAKILQAAERCARIVRNFLALARQFPPERKQVELNQVVEDAVELLAYQLRMDNVEVGLDLAQDLPVLWADPHQLNQVLVNLITNAQHAMREAPLPRRLTVRTSHEPREGRVCLEVTDTGPGVPLAIQARIFEPFFTTKPPGQGTGLGLSLCHGIVEAHGGTIGVDSQSGQGATFWVELPVVAPPDAEAEAGAWEAAPPVRGKAILVVEDEPEIAALLAEMLAAGGQEVETAANGALALEKLRERAYDAILTDIRMPVLDGPGLYRELERRHPDLVRRVIFLTGDTLGPDTAEFLDRTGAHILIKPFRVEEVTRVVQQVLRGAEEKRPRKRD